ncbi:hypothetical protein PIROE2DRAFT_62805 [Piromyces sp. E2]|nr:hypothetical protein PIROE2DRAFT_62805 [Piromyces sp. E2]|eukprot:OUM60971.1 hypothetical protein PIROE2DRAFT_62805 [Piromyces sp. E2]
MAVKSKFQLSEEQNLFIKEALSGKNILVDACIGSGKTTAIQKLCNEYSSNKKVLYLTYNKLLKIDAQNEYQDITEEISNLLKYIKSYNPSMQIIAVGDMEQKIYDYTTLDVLAFIKEFLGDFKKLEFTKCFRLSDKLASMLGRIWHKNIVGVNEDCIVEEMRLNDVIDILSKQKPKDILCLGKNKGQRDVLLNSLESSYPKIFNKNTVYAKISDSESLGVTKPNSNSAIFTTYDSSKGLEKNICVLCDFTEKYWNSRLEMPNARYEIIRNIFCVAASRGKKRIIFLKNNEYEGLLSEKKMSTFVNTVHDFKVFEMSSMFDFKYREDIKRCYDQLNIERIKMEDTTEISINSSDGLIDLSPCIGNYQEAVFFDNYDIDTAIQSRLSYSKIQKELKKSTENLIDIDSVIENIEKTVAEQYKSEFHGSSLDKKILYLTTLDTKQERYKHQVKVPFVTSSQKELIVNRLKTQFKTNEEVQVKCKIEFAYGDGRTEKFQAIGSTDVIKDNVVYELKFVSELSHEHFLQCASYMVALELDKGILWNTKDNTMYSITIPDRIEFLNCMVRAITKGIINQYYNPNKAPYQYSSDDDLIIISSKKTINDYWEERKRSIDDIEEIEDIDEYIIKKQKGN